VGGHHYKNLHRHILQELLACRCRRARVFARSCEMPPCTTIVCILWLPASSYMISVNLHLNVLCRTSTPTANMDPDQPNAEKRAATARLAVSEIMRIPLEVATGPTCTPQGVCAIRARFTFKCATSGRRGASTVTATIQEASWLGRASGKGGSTFDRPRQGRQVFQRPACKCKVPG